MPGAMAKGLLADSAMHNVPMDEHRHVDRNMAFHSGVPGLKPVRMLGFRATMYPIVKNVDMPARISVLTVVPFAVSPNLFSGLNKSENISCSLRHGQVQGQNVRCRPGFNPGGTTGDVTVRYSIVTRIKT